MIEQPKSKTLPEIELAQERVAALYEKLDQRKDETRPLRHLIDECVERAQSM